MPTIEENLAYFDRLYDWPADGDEWSADFGGTGALWSSIIWPRISRFLPTGRILEIGPGRGRWTVRLLDHCESLVLVDLSPTCIEKCRARFANRSNISYHVTDGKSLAMIEPASIDFVFSFDSLVHAEVDVMQAYVSQFATILKPSGVGFIHHSNLGQYWKRRAVINWFPRKWSIRPNVARILSLNTPAWRAPSMTAAAFRTMCLGAGLKCFDQELISWQWGCKIDALSCLGHGRIRS